MTISVDFRNVFRSGMTTSRDFRNEFRNEREFINLLIKYLTIIKLISLEL